MRTPPPGLPAKVTAWLWRDARAVPSVSQERAGVRPL